MKTRTDTRPAPRRIQGGPEPYAGTRLSFAGPPAASPATYCGRTSTGREYVPLPTVEPSTYTGRSPR